MTFTQALGTTFPLFALILLGFVLVRYLRWPESVGDALGRFVFTIALPAMLLNLTSNLANLPPLDPRVLIAYFGGYLAAFFALRLLGPRLLGYEPVAAAVFGTAAIYGNIVLLGLPLISSVLGQNGLATAVPIIAVNSIVMWSLATIAVELARGDGLSFQSLSAIGKGFFSNPLIVAMLGGALISLLGLTIPAPIRATLQLLQDSAVPLALVTMGMGLAGYRIASGLRDALVMSVAKLIVLPILVVALALAIGLPPLETQVLALLASAPMGVNAFLISRRFGALQGEVSTAMLVSTLASSALTPILIVALRRLDPTTVAVP